MSKWSQAENEDNMKREDGIEGDNGLKEEVRKRNDKKDKEE